MLTRSNTKARLSALEAYMDMPTEHRGMTITGRLEAQHSVLVALRADVNDLRTDVNDLRTETNRRLTNLEVGMGTVQHGITEIKNLLQPPDDPSAGPPPNGRPPAG